MFFGVPQGSILGLLLFSFFRADLFFIVNSTDIGNYADDKVFFDNGFHNIPTGLLRLIMRKITFWDSPKKH